MKIIIASDHKGIHLKKCILSELKASFEVIDCETHDEISSDYPDYALLVVQNIIQKKANLGILICGTGIGMSMAANRHKQIRAALCYNEKAAMLARKHNNANILVLGAEMLTQEEALKCVAQFINTEFEGGRHQRRIDKIS